MIRSLVDRLVTRPWLVAAGVLVFLAVWVGSGLVGDRTPHDAESASGAPGAAAETGPVDVTVERIAAQPVTRVVTLSGRTAPARVVELKAETTGRVVAVGAPRGARVARGALIARLDDADRSARLAQAQATLRQRELEYDGQLKLKPAGYISEARLAESAAQLEAARAEVSRARLDIARMEIRAPFDGALQERDLEVGDYVSPGTRVATFVDDRTLVVAASMSEMQAAAVTTRTRGTARLATGQTVEGVVRYRAPVADESTRTFAVELEFANPRGDLPVGVTAEVDVPVGTVMAHRVSPALLTLDDAGTVGIKLLDDSGRVTFIPATVARSSADGVWLSGLPDPAPVITVGQGFVRPGQLARAAPAISDGEALAQRAGTSEPAKKE
jgi:multidrug efflux system membrane fusion protein